MSEHARVFSASSFERLMLCPGSAVLALDAPRTASVYSAEGTAIHAASAAVLAGTSDWPAFGARVEADGLTFNWDADMQECGQAYVDYVRGLNGDTLLVEQRVAFGPALGIDDPDDGFGTADAVVAKGDELIVVDLKCGRGVEVTAGSDEPTGPGFVFDEELPYVNGKLDAVRKPNPQLALYAIGALAAVDGLLEDFKTVRLVIVQPRLNAISEYVLTTAELEAWAETTGAHTVNRVLDAQTFDDSVGGFAELFLNPTEKGCRFCPTKATCPALRGEVAGTLGQGEPATPEDFAEIAPLPPADTTSAWLAACLSKVDLIEDWCKAVRAEVERRLCEGQPVPGYKLVAGKKGARAWSDEAEAEEVLRKKMRLPVEKAYNLKLISPPQAEKLHKAGDIGPRQWPKLQALITQGEGKPHVAPESDPRPAITVAATPDDFI